MFSRSDNFRVSMMWDGLRSGSEDTALALDLSTFKPVSLGGGLKRLASHAYTFLDSERVLGTLDYMQDAGVFSFPSGKRLKKFAFGANEIKRTANPDYVVIKLSSGAMTGFFDVNRGVVASGVDKPDAALWNDMLVYEATNGKVLLRQVSYEEAENRFSTKDVGSLDLPVGSISSLDVAEVSDNHKWLLMSSKTRGGLWNLETGERKLYLRGFRGGLVADDGGAISAFPALHDTPHSLVVMNPHQSTATPRQELPKAGARQFGRFVLLRTSLKKTDKKREEIAQLIFKVNEEHALRSDVKFELVDFLQSKVVWAREFRKEAPDYSFDEFSGRLVFYWRLGSETGKAKLKESAELAAKADALGNKSDDYLVEVVDSFAQKTIGMLLLETGKGSFDVGEGISERNWLVLHDSEGRVLVYSLDDGELRHRFFGKRAAINPSRNLIAVETSPGEVALYDLDEGERQASFVVNGSAAFFRFNLKGDRLFVLSGVQTGYAFDLNKVATNKTTARSN